MRNKRTVKEFLTITVGTLIIAIAVYFFMTPSHVSVGSVAALAMVLHNFVPLPISAITLIMNIVLLIVGFLLLGQDFGVKTVYTSVLLPGFMALFELLFPDFQSITADPLLDVICYILVVGMGLAMLFSCNCSSGGLDTVAMLMNKYLRIELGKAMSLSGILVALSSALCYDKKTVVLSVLGTYFGGIVLDHFIFGMNLKRRVCIISPKVDEIVDYIIHGLNSGVSLYDCIGGYDGKTRREINVIVDKEEYKHLMDYMKRTDPKAFITVYSVNEIRYQPKK